MDIISNTCEKEKSQKIYKFFMNIDRDVKKILVQICCLILTRLFIRPKDMLNA